VLAGVLTSCSEENPIATFAVTYSAAWTGQSTVAAVTYEESSGPVTVTAPATGWSVVVQMLAGERVGITADGTVHTGLIRVTMSAVTSGLSPVEALDQCVESAGIPAACTVTIPSQPLP